MPIQAVPVLVVLTQAAAAAVTGSLALLADLVL
jgi:divalent metal cation (Fe/Co/Zn/Cd) transporter